MKLKFIRPIALPCSYCGAAPGEKCIVTLDPEHRELSVPWNHRARERELVS